MTINDYRALTAAANSLRFNHELTSVEMLSYEQMVLAVRDRLAMRESDREGELVRPCEDIGEMI